MTPSSISISNICASRNGEPYCLNGLDTFLLLWSKLIAKRGNHCGLAADGSAGSVGRGCENTELNWSKLSLCGCEATLAWRHPGSRPHMARSCQSEPIWRCPFV